MKVVAKIDGYSGLVQMTKDEWDKIQDARYKEETAFEAGREIKIGDVYDTLRSIKKKEILTQTDAMVKSAEKIISIASKIKEWQ